MRAGRVGPSKVDKMVLSLDDEGSDSLEQQGRAPPSSVVADNEVGRGKI